MIRLSPNIIFGTILKFRENSCTISLQRKLLIESPDRIPRTISRMNSWRNLQREPLQKSPEATTGGTPRRNFYSNLLRNSRKKTTGGIYRGKSCSDPKRISWKILETNSRRNPQRAHSEESSEGTYGESPKGTPEEINKNNFLMNLLKKRKIPGGTRKENPRWNQHKKFLEECGKGSSMESPKWTHLAKKCWTLI